jgi:DNA invertase Pin-like site-specific DNA recombinase
MLIYEITEADLPKRRCVGHCRLSKAGQEGGAEVQESIVRDYARIHRLPIHDWYNCTSKNAPRGKQGDILLDINNARRKAKRSQRYRDFLRLVEDGEAGKYDCILIPFSRPYRAFQR